MAVMREADKTPLPGTVFSPRQVRMLKVAVIAMGVMLVVGFAFVIAVIAYQASNLGQDKPAATATATIPGVETALTIPEGATVTSMALDGDRLALQLNSSAGPEIAVIDLTTGKVISRIRLKTQ